ncbi:hypothetical protein CYMTET_36183, partial [Cymbomonas tetramitiformis]
DNYEADNYVADNYMAAHHESALTRDIWKMRAPENVVSVPPTWSAQCMTARGMVAKLQLGKWKVAPVSDYSGPEDARVDARVDLDGESLPAVKDASALLTRRATSRGGVCAADKEGSGGSLEPLLSLASWGMHCVRTPGTLAIVSLARAKRFSRWSTWTLQLQRSRLCSAGRGLLHTWEVKCKRCSTVALTLEGIGIEGVGRARFSGDLAMAAGAAAADALPVRRWSAWVPGHQSGVQTQPVYVDAKANTQATSPWFREKAAGILVVRVYKTGRFLFMVPRSALPLSGWTESGVNPEYRWSWIGSSNTRLNCGGNATPTNTYVVVLVASSGDSVDLAPAAGGVASVQRMLPAEGEVLAPCVVRMLAGLPAEGEVLATCVVRMLAGCRLRARSWRLAWHTGFKELPRVAARLKHTGFKELPCVAARLKHTGFKELPRVAARLKHTGFKELPRVAARLKHTGFKELPRVAARLKHTGFKELPRVAARLKHTGFEELPCVAARLKHTGFKELPRVAARLKHTGFKELPRVAARLKHTGFKELPRVAARLKHTGFKELPRVAARLKHTGFEELMVPVGTLVALLFRKDTLAIGEQEDWTLTSTLGDPSRKGPHAGGANAAAKVGSEASDLEEELSAECGAAIGAQSPGS